MGRQLFKRDLCALQDRLTATPPRVGRTTEPTVTRVRAGDNDGEVVFAVAVKGRTYSVCVSVDTGSYPKQDFANAYLEDDVEETDAVGEAVQGLDCSSATLDTMTYRLEATLGNSHSHKHYHPPAVVGKTQAQLSPSSRLCCQVAAVNAASTHCQAGIYTPLGRIMLYVKADTQWLLQMEEVMLEAWGIPVDSHLVVAASMPAMIRYGQPAKHTSISFTVHLLPGNIHTTDLKDADTVKHLDSQGRAIHFAQAWTLKDRLDHGLLNLMELRAAHDLGWGGGSYVLDRAAKGHPIDADLLAQAHAHDTKDADGGFTSVSCTLLQAIVEYTQFVMVQSSKCCPICRADHALALIKPSVCADQLCIFQSQELSLGPDIDHEVLHDPEVVELLLDMMQSATGDHSNSQANLPTKLPRVDQMLGPADYNGLLQRMPPVQDMRSWLQQGKSLAQELAKTDAALYPVLRYAISSNRTHLKLLPPTHGPMTVTELPQGQRSYFGYTYTGMGTARQFMVVSGTPEKECRFQAAATEARMNGGTGTFFAFHGSRANNWHSIMRTGLNFDRVATGRVYGDGIYLGADLLTSMGYATSADFKGNRYVAVCEVVDRKDRFLSTTPHYVVNELDWVQVRYLLVIPSHQQATVNLAVAAASAGQIKASARPHSPTSDATRLLLPLPVPSGHTCDLSLEDKGVLIMDSDGEDAESSESEQSDADDYDLEIDEPPAKKFRLEEEAADEAAAIPVADYSTTQATKALQQQLRVVHRDLEATAQTDRHYSMDTTAVDNLYRWRVTLINFDAHLPLAQELQEQGYAGVELELHFAPNYPFTPPFVRIVRPRFLQHMHGGGGNVTRGGSICMDLLTDQAWSPVYTIPAVLLQIKMALSDTERPARLNQNHGMAYGVGEAVEAFKIVASSHGWPVPKNFLHYFTD